MNLDDLPHLRSSRLQALKQTGIHTIDDLLRFAPYRYVDKTRLYHIEQLTGDEEAVMVRGRLMSVRQTGFGNKKRLEAAFKDETGMLNAVWFRGAGYIHRILKKGNEYTVFGKARRYGQAWSMAHPEIEPIKPDNDLAERKEIRPVYPGNSHLSKARISSKLITSWIRHILSEYHIDEILPETLLQRQGYPSRKDAFRMIHSPVNLQEPRVAIERLKFEELFLFQLAMARIRHLHVDEKTGIRMDTHHELSHRFLRHQLPFELTPGQQTAIKEIYSDLASGHQMHRLLQGDVGSGKTVIAIAAMLRAVEHGYQSVLMAPTEILAEQHYHTLENMLRDSNLTIRLLTGGQSVRHRRDILTSVEGGQTDIVVGTHAIIQKDVSFHKLGLAVVDEQHRFGVKQRAEILTKGTAPHLLVMSATPIPRSLALSIYSDLDISVVKGLPSGRKPVKTAVRTNRNREEIYRFVEQNAKEGGQAYVVYPLIEESEALDLRDATFGFEQIRSRFPDLDIGLLHGQMEGDQKERVMNRFVSGDLDLLVSTTVIEVGVDVPNANLMIIEHAERFGLSQLHQLRGRIGRGDRQSYCILIPGESLGSSGRFRLQKMIESNDGFEIAEADLQLRGPGDFLGTKQSGLPEFKFADILEDRNLLELARTEAGSIIRKDPMLHDDSHRALNIYFEPYYRKRIELFGLG